MSEQTSDEKYLLQSVNNALAIIDVLCEHDNLGLAELASYMNLGKSTVFRLLYTLQRKGYVSKDRNSKYHLSFKFARIGTIVTKRSELIELIHPFLMELSALSGETAHLVTWHSDTEIIFVDKVIGTATISMQSMVGFTRTAHKPARLCLWLSYGPCWLIPHQRLWALTWNRRRLSCRRPNPFLPVQSWNDSYPKFAPRGMLAMMRNPRQGSPAMPPLLSAWGRPLQLSVFQARPPAWS